MVARKHIRAALLKVNNLRQSGIAIPPLPIPTTELEAQLLQASLVASQAVTPQQRQEVFQELPLSKVAAVVTEMMGRDLNAFEEVEDQEPSSEAPDDDLESVGTNEGDEFDFVSILSSTSYSYILISSI